ncbi:MAG: hypothetical protein GY788_09870, partial [bacterium]|nr:hypothetical protein [bacterium]
FLGTIVDPLIPLVQDYTPKGTAYFPNIEIDKYRATPELTYSDGMLYSSVLTDEKGFVDIITIYYNDEPIGNKYFFRILRYEGLRRLEIIEGIGYSDDINLIQQELINDFGYDTGTIYYLDTASNRYLNTPIISKTFNDRNYSTQIYTDSESRQYNQIKFTGTDFLESLRYDEEAEVTYSQFLDTVTIINNLQVQCKIDSGIPKFYITNKDTSTENATPIDENDMLEIEGERLQIEEGNYDVFDILDTGFKDTILPYIKYYYNQFIIDTNRQISFLLSNITTDYDFKLEDSFAYNSTDWKVSRISRESEKIKRV